MKSIFFRLAIFILMSTTTYSQHLGANQRKLCIDSNQIRTQLEPQGIKNQLTHLGQKQDSIVSEDSQIIQQVKELSNKSKLPWESLIPLIVAVIAGAWALLYVKGNIISSARIDWIENLRGAVSELISEIEMINESFRDVKELAQKDKVDEAIKLFNMKKNEMKNLRTLLYKVKLYLSPKEADHILLDEKLDKFTSIAISDYDRLDDSQKLLSLNSEIIDLAKKILKQAWEDAKTTKFHEVFRIQR